MSWELFEKVKELGLPAGSYAIFGSGPMAVRGLRECQDIDLIVTDGLFEEYKGMSEWELKDIEGREMIVKDGIEMGDTWWPGQWDVEQLIEDADVIEGLPFVRLAEVLKWKKLAGREKDLKDIEILEDYFRKQGMVKSAK